MKEKNIKNGCNILIMTFTNLEKYVYSKKGLKQRRQPPPQPLPPAKSKVFWQLRNRKIILKVPSFWTIVTNHWIFTTEQNCIYWF